MYLNIRCDVFNVKFLDTKQTERSPAKKKTKKEREGLSEKKTEREGRKETSQY